MTHRPRCRYADSKELRGAAEGGAVVGRGVGERADVRRRQVNALIVPLSLLMLFTLRAPAPSSLAGRRLLLTRCGARLIY